MLPIVSLIAAVLIVIISPLCITVLASVCGPVWPGSFSHDVGSGTLHKPPSTFSEE